MNKTLDRDIHTGYNRDMMNRYQPQPQSQYSDYNNLYNYFVFNYGEETAEWAMEYIREHGHMPEGY